MRQSQPLVTVITAVKNGAARLSSTLDSVQATAQAGCHIEHIVVDGGSTDGTLELLSARRSRYLHLVLETDDGIYAALNKGVDRAQGKWLLFLGDDDAIVDPGTFASVMAACLESDADIICANSRYRGSRSRMSRLDWRIYVFNTLHHQAVLYHRRLFDDFRYRTDIPVVADYELNFIAYRRGFKRCRVDAEIAICGARGVSRTSSQLRNRWDLYRIRGRYLNPLSNTLLLAVGAVDLLVASARRILRRR